MVNFNLNKTLSYQNDCHLNITLFLKNTVRKILKLKAKQKTPEETNLKFGQQHINMDQQRPSEHGKNETKLTNNDEFSNQNKSSNIFLLMRCTVTYEVSEIFFSVRRAYMISMDYTVDVL